jgi:O-antigen/teichoic acid export membrane protein
MERRTEWFRAGLLTLLEKGAGLVFSLGTTVLLLRGLSKEDFAAWGLFLIITYTLEMGRNGLIQNGFIRFLNTHRQDKGAKSAISSAALFLSLCFSLIILQQASWMLHRPPASSTALQRGARRQTAR